MSKTDYARNTLFSNTTLWVAICLGVANLTTTALAIVTKTGKFIFFLEYPAAAVAFVAIPIGLMLALSHFHEDLTSRTAKNVFAAILLMIFTLLAIMWILTFDAAYSNTGSDDPFAPEPLLSIFRVHISIQILAEVFGGALLLVFGNQKNAHYYKDMLVKSMRSQARHQHIVELRSEREAPEDTITKYRLNKSSHAASRNAYAESILAKLEIKLAERDKDESLKEADRKIREADARLSDAKELSVKTQQKAAELDEKIQSAKSGINNI